MKTNISPLVSRCPISTRPNAGRASPAPLGLQRGGRLRGSLMALLCGCLALLSGLMPGRAVAAPVAQAALVNFGYSYTPSAYQVKWYVYYLKTQGSYTFSGGSFYGFEHGLYNSSGTLVARSFAGQSSVTATLAPGNYYLAVGAPNMTFGQNWAVTCDSGSGGSQVTVSATGPISSPTPVEEIVQVPISQSNVIGGWTGGTTYFTVGQEGTNSDTNNWPAAESPAKAVDGNSSTKFLMFKGSNAGLIFSPVAGSPAPNRLVFTTANDSEERDPASYALYGYYPSTLTNSTPGYTYPQYFGADFMLLSSGSLTLPSARGATAEVAFTNNTLFQSYILVFPSTKTNTGITQIADVQMSRAAPDIEVTGNGYVIDDGSTTTDFGKGTDFGSATVEGGSVVRSFTIQNYGPAPLLLTGIPIVEFSPANSGDFFVSQQPSVSSIPPYGSTSFAVAFSPVASGLRSATILIRNTDPDAEGYYTFAIQGTGAVSNNANLSALTTSAGVALSPGFSSGVTSYSATVPNATSSITVTPTRAQAGASIQARVNGSSFANVNSGSASSALALNVGANTLDVKVIAEDGSTTKTYTLSVTRALPGPTVTGISPSSGSTLGGQSVTITGFNFAGATAVTIGGTAVTNLVVVNATTITCMAPAGTVGTASVLVTTPNGTNTANTLFTYLVLPPTLNWRDSDLPSNATILKINGSGFSTTPGNNIITFMPNGSGTITAATASELIVRNLSGLTLGTLYAVVTTNGQNSGAPKPVRTVVVPEIGDSDALDANVAGYNVYATALQPDGKIVLGGSFTSVLGQPRNNIARLNVDGTLDLSFNPNANNSVTSLVVQTDGQILLGGAFTSVGGVTRNYIARVAANGTVDAGFNPDANAIVGSVIVQPDNQILLGGGFTSVGGTTRNHIARVATNGTVDASFNPNANNSVTTMALQADSQIVLGGGFTSVGGTARNGIARVAANGMVDAGFNPNANNVVRTLVVQPDGNILFGGDFTSVGGVTRNFVARVASTGALDMGFDPSASQYITDVALQADGKVLIGGWFSRIGGVFRPTCARVNANGTLDPGFDSHMSSLVYCVALQADGKVLLGGEFSSAGRSDYPIFARLLNNPATQSLTIPSASRVQWLRGGTSPEVEQVTFELSTDGGTVFSMIGAGTRISGGWERTGLSLPGSGLIRARGRTIGGSSLVETMMAFPANPPAVDLVTPAIGSIAGGTSVTITGTGFTGVTGVTIGGAAATSVNVVNNTTITCTTPAGAAGTTSVLVTTHGGTNVVNTLYSYVAPPTITGITPASGSMLGGTTVTITGTNFTSASSVTIGGAAATNVNVVSPTSITCTTPAGTVGGRSVLVIAPGGINEGNTLFTYGLPGPTVTTISPSTGGTAGGTSVTITGAYFDGASSVTIGGAEATNINVVSPTSITCTTPAGIAGPKSVLVTTPHGTNEPNTLYTYILNNTAPSFVLPAPTWMARESNRGWRTITSSADGNRLAAAVVYGHIYTSMDGGLSWTEREGYRAWTSITSSADGNKLAAVGEEEQIYTSTDSGVSWTPRESNRRWSSITSSADGSKLAAVVRDGRIYTSTDSGVSWTPRESSRFWISITSSADGSKLAAVVNGGQLYTSTDSGVSWTARESNRAWTSITSSADGSKLAAMEGGRHIYTSTDSGVSWTPRESSRYWTSISSSADGSMLAAAEYGGQIYTSTDSGVSWTVGESNRNWYAIHLSATGSKLAAVASEDQIHVLSLTMTVDAGPIPTTIPSFASNISPGPAVDAWQTVNFTVTNDNNTLFTGQPAISSDGTLSFTPGPGPTGGTAIVTVFAVDNGGTALSGSDTSAPQSFSITILPGAVVTGVNPPTGTLAGGTDVTITGRFFTGATQVTFNDIPATNVVVVSDTSITCTTPSGSPGPASVRVTTPEGTSKPNALFAYPAPKIVIRGNAVVISSGDSTPSAADNSDFGPSGIASGATMRTFTIANTGTGTLNLTGTPIVAVSGAHVGDFIVTPPLSPIVDVGESTVFQVAFSPTATGLRSAVLTIANDDLDVNSYQFSIQGLGTNPSIALTGNSTAITDGDDTPISSDHTDFGSATLLGTQVTRSFTIANNGTGPLNFTGQDFIQISGPDAADFTVTQEPTAPLGEGQSTTFSITFDPNLPGQRRATVTIANDSSTPSFDFAITGFGALPTLKKQTITFDPPASIYLSQSPLTLVATASSGLPVTLSLVAPVPSGTTLVNNVLTCTTAGTVKITASQAGGGNYAAAPNITSTITVKADPTALTLLNLTQTYDGNPKPISVIGASSPDITYKVGTTYVADAPTNVGTYALKVVVGTGTPKTGNLVIEPAVLTVTPDDLRKFAGQANPTLTYQISGLKGSDTEAVITKAPVLATTAKVTSPSGTYPITASGATASNYTFNYQAGSMVVESFAGSYEVLLTDATTSLPVAKLSITVPASSTSFTAKLATTTTAVAFKDDLTTNATSAQATGTATTSVTINKVSTPYFITFTLPLKGDVTASATRSGSALGRATDGRKLLILAKGQTVSYSGDHTAVLEPATPSASNVPAGAGWATADISTAGVMTLAGKLGDGTAFTSALSPDAEANPGYRLFLQPYKAARTESYLAGAFVLAPHPNPTSNANLNSRRYLEQATMTWKKAGLPADVTHRTGFGPVSTVLMLDPWLPPVAAKGSIPAITLGQRLGLAGSPSSFSVGHSPTGSSANGNLPTSLGLSDKNSVSVLAPLTSPLNSTKWKTLTFKATDGTFTGSFELADVVGTKTVLRPVTFSGVLRQPALASDELIGEGHYLMPQLSGTEKSVGEVMFTKPITP